MDSLSLKSLLACAALAVGLGGCEVQTARPVVYGSVTPQPAYVETNVDGDYVYEDAPGIVEGSPYVVYDGAPTYYVQGRWYRRTSRGWGYYRTEPQPLYGQRPYVQRAPVAYGSYGNGGYVNTAPRVYVNTAPPARRYTNTAPPARRHR